MSSSTGKRNLEGLLKDVLLISGKDLKIAFNEIATEMLLSNILVIGETKYRIREIEFYFSSAHQTHQDPYIHSNQYKTTRQSNFGVWYFHRFKTSEIYNHNRRGIDLTFGNRDKEISGGILIRSIQSLTSDKPIQGPSNVVAELKKRLDATDPTILHKVANDIDMSAFNTSKPLYIMSFQNPEQIILSTKRYGLSAKEADKGDDFKNKPYRYFDEAFLMMIKGKDGIFKELMKQNKRGYTIDLAKEKIGYNIKPL